MAGRHRGALVPGFDNEEPAVGLSVDPEPQFEPQPQPEPGAESESPVRSRRRVVLVAGVAVAILLVLVDIGVVLFSGTPGSTIKGSPPILGPTATATLERPVPVVYPTRVVYVPPVPTAAPTTPRPVPTPKTTTKTTTPPAQHRPPCPFQLPFFHDWCVRHGFEPPRG